MSLFGRLFGGGAVQRSPADQAAAQAEAGRLALYHFDGCPYCDRVRHTLKRLAIEVPLRDIHRDAGARAELVAGGGSPQVPCLRIPQEGDGVQWLYESADIIAYLQRRFG